jgi:hypothetical protein
MTLPDIRLSPSGAPLGSTDGSFDGFQLRHIDIVRSLLATALTTDYQVLLDIASDPSAVALVTPSPLRRYNVRCHFGAVTTTDAPGRLDVQLQGTYDAVTWFELGGNSINVEAAAEYLTAWADFPMTLGASLPTPMTGSPTLIGVRVRARSSENDLLEIPTATGFGNRIMLSLSELV